MRRRVYPMRERDTVSIRARYARVTRAAKRETSGYIYGKRTETSCTRSCAQGKWPGGAES